MCDEEEVREIIQNISYEEWCDIGISNGWELK
jgi:hypothetical protein